MATITSLAHPRGKGFGIASLIAVALPLPWLVTLCVLAFVVRSEPVGGVYGSEYWIYGLLASIGLLAFPAAFLTALALAIAAVKRPRRAGKVMGWITISMVILAIPLSWLAYSVWIVR